MAYDGDKAGVTAALKAANMLSKSGFDGSVVLFPDGKDPADMIAQGLVQEVANLLRAGQALIPFVIEMTAKSYNLHNPRDKEASFGTIKHYLENLSPIVREAYVPHASTVLGVSPALFGGNVKLENTRARFASSRDDVGQLSIVKTLLENRDFVDKVSNVIEPLMFGNYASLLDAVIRGEESPQLTGLLLDENIKVMNEHELTQTLASFLFRHYTATLKQITVDSTLPLAKKSFLIRKIKMDIMPQLKRGELVTYKF